MAYTKSSAGINPAEDFHYCRLVLSKAQESLKYLAPSFLPDKVKISIFEKSE
jgi:hypothetical protein